MAGKWKLRKWTGSFTGIAFGIGLAAPVLVAAQGAVVPVQAAQEPMERDQPGVDAGWPAFEELDTNGDGLIEQQDLSDSGLNLSDEQFAEVDVNQDQRLDAIEYQLAQGLFAGQMAEAPEDAAPLSSQDAPAVDPLMSQRAADLEGQIVNGMDGERIGQVGAVVIDQSSNQLYAVVSMGGILGFGARQAAIPLAALRIDQDDQLMASVAGSAEQISEQYPYEEERFQAAEADRTLAELARGEAAGAPAADIGTFQELDRDGDGFLSREELMQSEALGEHWDQIDTNRDDLVDRSEFARFEEQMEEGASMDEPSTDEPSTGSGSMPDGPTGTR